MGEPMIWRTDYRELKTPDPPSLEAKRIIFPVSWLVVDPERLPNDDEEPMAMRGMLQHIRSSRPESLCDGSPLLKVLEPIQEERSHAKWLGRRRRSMMRDHGEAEEGGDGAGITLEVASEAAVAADPGEGALDNPALGQNDEAMGVAALDDLQGPGAGLGDDLGHLWPLITGVGKDAFDEGEGSPRRAQQVACTIAVLHAGRVDDHAQQEAQHIDQDVALAAGDFLARIKALRVERRAPF